MISYLYLFLPSTAESITTPILSFPICTPANCHGKVFISNSIDPNAHPTYNTEDKLHQTHKEEREEKEVITLLPFTSSKTVNV